MSKLHGQALPGWACRRCHLETLVDQDAGRACWLASGTRQPAGLRAIRMSRVMAWSTRCLKARYGAESST